VGRGKGWLGLGGGKVRYRRHGRSSEGRTRVCVCEEEYVDGGLGGGSVVGVGVGSSRVTAVRSSKSWSVASNTNRSPAN
jgi:hypothetical protein